MIWYSSFYFSERKSTYMNCKEFLDYIKYNLLNDYIKYSYLKDHEIEVYHEGIDEEHVDSSQIEINHSEKKIII